MQSRLLRPALGSPWVMASVVGAGVQEASERTPVARLPNPAAIDGNGAKRLRPATAPDIRLLIADPAFSK